MRNFITKLLMKHNPSTVRPLSCLLLLIAVRCVSLASAKPFIQFPTSNNDSLGVAGFPALEILPANNNQAMIVTRESRLQSNITYSSGYGTPTSRFTRPTFFSFSLYGYYAQPQWKGIKSVNFKFGNQTYSAKPIYGVQGPERDRSSDAQDSEYFESMIVTIPTETAKRIVSNGGVLITTTPASSSVLVSASQLARFKQVVDSVEAIAKREVAKQKGAPSSRPSSAKLSRPSKARLGLPVTEVFDGASGTNRLETAIVGISDNLAISGLAWTEEQGKRLKTPFTAVMIMSVSDGPIWEHVDSVTFSYASQKLQLKPNAYKAGRKSDGTYVEVMTVPIPYRYFVPLVKSPKFYITIDTAGFVVNNQQSAGLQELARRISR